MTFEHKVLIFKFGWKGFDYTQMERDLNELGSEGWETVGTLAPSIGSGHANEIAIFVKRARA